MEGAVLYEDVGATIEHGIVDAEHICTVAEGDDGDIGEVEIVHA